MVTFVVQSSTAQHEHVGGGMGRHDGIDTDGKPQVK